MSFRGDIKPSVMGELVSCLLQPLIRHNCDKLLRGQKKNTSRRSAMGALGLAKHRSPRHLWPWINTRDTRDGGM